VTTAQPSLVIRKAATADASTLTQIAHDAKRHWGYPEHWIQHWQKDLTISPDFIAANEVYVAESEGKLVGFYALVVAEQKAELDHLWVAPPHIGTGVEILADPNAEGFYRKMGAHRVGESTSELDGVPRILPRLAIDPSTDAGVQGPEDSD
jgi:hypothetical protein